MLSADLVQYVGVAMDFVSVESLTTGDWIALAVLVASACVFMWD